MNQLLEQDQQHYEAHLELVPESTLLEQVVSHFKSTVKIETKYQFYAYEYTMIERKDAPWKDTPEGGILPLIPPAIEEARKALALEVKTVKRSKKKAGVKDDNNVTPFIVPGTTKPYTGSSAYESGKSYTMAGGTYADRREKPLSFKSLREIRKEQKRARKMERREKAKGRIPARYWSDYDKLRLTDEERAARVRQYPNDYPADYYLKARGL